MTVDIEDWTWGRTTSFEVHIKYDSFNDYSSIFYFGDGGGSDNVILGNSGTTSTISWNVRPGKIKQEPRLEQLGLLLLDALGRYCLKEIMKLYKNGGRRIPDRRMGAQLPYPTEPHLGGQILGWFEPIHGRHHRLRQGVARR